MVVLILILIVLIYSALPLPLQLVLFLVNMFFPDPVPFLDETIMIVSMANKAKLISRLYTLLRKHRVIGIIAIGAFVAAVIVCIVYLCNALISYLY